MKELLKLLNDQIAALRPEYFARLQPGCTNEALAALEAQYSIALPDDLRELYRWKNGQAQTAHDSFINNSIFLPLEDVLSAAKELDEMIPDFDSAHWWRKGWLPVFHNGGGDYICYDTEGTFTGAPGQLIEFWHADEDRNVIAPTLEALLQSLSAYYRDTPVGQYDSYFTVKESTGFPKSFSAE